MGVLFQCLISGHFAPGAQMKWALNACGLAARSVPNAPSNFRAGATLKMFARKLDNPCARAFRLSGGTRD